MDGRPVDLARARREAKALLRAARADDPDARLADAQLAVARSLGARSWPALVRRVEGTRAFVLAATSGRASEPPADVDGVDVALVLGDLDRIGPALGSGPLGARGWEPLLYVTHSAFVGGSRTDGLLACARALLDAGADPNVARDDGETALRGSVRDPRMTALLLAAGADPDDGRSLRDAAGAEDPACLTLLLDAGATLVRAMALAHAAGRDRVATARVLLERGPADWGERENALVWAVQGEASPAMLRLLVEHGADLEASFDGTGRTPYALARRAGRDDLAEALLGLGARREVEPLDALVGACVSGDAEGARVLATQHPEAARLVRTSEAHLLAEMARAGRREAVAALLAIGVRADARGASGETPLLATTDPAIAALLTAHGADPRMKPPADVPRGDEPDYAELAWEVETAYLRHLAMSPLAKVRSCGDGFAVITGVADDTENGVVCSRLEGGEEELLAWLRGTPARWFVGRESDLGPRLVAAGGSPERTAVVMGADVERLAPGRAPAPAPARTAATPPGLDIVPVRDEPALAEWMRVAGQTTIDGDDPELARRAAVIASLGLHEDAPLQLRLARRDGQTIGIVSWFVHGDVALGHHLGVLAHERRGGVGRALAQAVGARTIIVAPTPDAIGFYRLLGCVLRQALRDRTFYVP